jgi:hypothetical protein
LIPRRRFVKDNMRVVDEKLLSSGVVLAALGIALIAASVRELAGTGAGGRQLNALVGRLALRTGTHVGLMLFILAGGMVFAMALCPSERVAEPLLVAVYLISAVGTWWLCRDNTELQRLGIVMVAAVGVWLLA